MGLGAAAQAAMAINRLPNDEWHWTIGADGRRSALVTVSDCGLVKVVAEDGCTEIDRP